MWWSCLSQLFLSLGNALVNCASLSEFVHWYITLLGLLCLLLILVLLPICYITQGTRRRPCRCILSLSHTSLSFSVNEYSSLLSSITGSSAVFPGDVSGQLGSSLSSICQWLSFWPTFSHRDTVSMLFGILSLLSVDLLVLGWGEVCTSSASSPQWDINCCKGNCVARSNTVSTSKYSNNTHCTAIHTHE